ncbi:MAG: sugar phosphate isomerase/epimerase [Candidatus Latescibacteria bacterium]|jgi:sugar phosphate isomerase/epimerase|nr:sugar phosphate isomerase/epimerase [Candidatus Latescibacterota bacterium]
MPLAACIWALTCPEETALKQIADAGFTHIDIRPGYLQTSDLQQQAQDLNLTISCIAASAEMPEGASLVGDNPQPARDHLCRAFDHAASLGATTAYLVPEGDDPDRFAEPLPILAESAQNAGLKLGIEHFPDTILPTVPFTLDYLQKIGHPNLYLLFDIGHAQMANENPADMIALAGDRLAYVHLDDNDGENDLHLSLCDGVLTEDVLQSTFTALHSANYTGNMSLELKPDIPEPLDALKRSRTIVLKNQL